MHKRTTGMTHRQALAIAISRLKLLGEADLNAVESVKVLERMLASLERNAAKERAHKESIKMGVIGQAVSKSMREE